MTGERNLADFQDWALAVLGLLGAEASHQVKYLRMSGVEADEIVLQLDDLLHVARARMADGSLKNEDYLAIQAVNERADVLNSMTGSIWAAAALGEAPEWRDLRAAAQAARLSLERSWSQDSSN